MAQDFFHEELILPELEATDRIGAIQAIGQQMEHKGYINDKYTPSVIEREKDFPTGLKLVSAGIAIPHATPMGNVLENGIAVARLKKPVIFHLMEDPDSTVEADLIFLLALKDSGQHLDILKQLFVTFQDDTIVRGLMTCQGPKEILHILRSHIQ